MPGFSGCPALDTSGMSAVGGLGLLGRGNEVASWTPHLTFPDIKYRRNPVSHDRNLEKYQRKLVHSIARICKRKKTMAPFNLVVAQKVR